MIKEIKVREIKDHQVEGAETSLAIMVMDEPGAGGAHHRYDIIGLNINSNKSRTMDAGPVIIELLFQNGTITENGVNGLTQEALLAINIDRLRCFQAGPFASPDNQEALEYMEKALECLHRRTKNRLARNVEGKHEA